MSTDQVRSLITDPGRLAALASYDVLGTPAEPGFDDVVHLACQICAVPVSLVSLVAEDRQWFKASVGFPLCETDLNSSVCAHALARPDAVLVIPDLLADARTATNPLVTGEPFIRFYAGAPLVTPEGHVLGTLCVIDRQPRSEGLTDVQEAALRALARQVVTQLELRRAMVARDALRAREAAAFQAREALHEAQFRMAAAGADRDTVLREVVRGALQAVPAAEGGTVGLFEGDDLVYHAAQGVLVDHDGMRMRMPVHGSLAGRCALTHAPVLLADAWTDPHVRRSLAEKLGTRSAVLAPILRGDRVLGVLELRSSRPGAFGPEDLEQARLFAGAATAGFAQVAEAQARAAVQASEIYWRGLFDRLSEGFVVGEVIRDGGGQVTDWRYVQVNPAWADLVGTDPAAVVGRTVRELFPDIEDEWVTEFAAVVDTGRPAKFTRQVGRIHRWSDGRTFRLDGEQFGVLFLDATARVEAEHRRAALLQIGDRLRDLTDVPAMTRAAAEIVGRTLNATRAGFGRVDADLEFVQVEPDWTAPGVASIAGRHRFEDYGDVRAHLARGEPLVIEDVTTDPRTRDDPGPMRALGIGSLVNMPVRERGRAVAVFIVHDERPRAWSPEALAFLRNVADRVEAGVARVRAEERQAVLNRELAHRLKNTLAIVQSIAAQTLKGVSERDLVEAFERRVLALSRAHDVLMQKSWSAARMRAVMESVLALQTDLDRFALDGPDLDLTPEAALSLSLLLHEMATNALKYGALSAAEGKIIVRWRAEEASSPTLVLGWTEEGGPPVRTPPSRRGFGSRLIRMGLLGTRQADLRYEPGGLRAEFRAPMAEMQVR